MKTPKINLKTFWMPTNYLDDFWCWHWQCKLIKENFSHVHTIYNIHHFFRFLLLTNTFWIISSDSFIDNTLAEIFKAWPHLLNLEIFSYSDHLNPRFCFRLISNNFPSFPFCVRKYLVSVKHEHSFNISSSGVFDFI